MAKETRLSSPHGPKPEAWLEPTACAVGPKANADHSPCEGPGGTRKVAASASSLMLGLGMRPAGTVCLAWDVVGVLSGQGVGREPRPRAPAIGIGKCLRSPQKLKWKFLNDQSLMTITIWKPFFSRHFHVLHGQKFHKLCYYGNNNTNASFALFSALTLHWWYKSKGGTLARIKAAALKRTSSHCVFHHCVLAVKQTNQQTKPHQSLMRQ